MMNRRRSISQSDADTEQAAQIHPGKKSKTDRQED